MFKTAIARLENDIYDNTKTIDSNHLEAMGKFEGFMQEMTDKIENFSKGAFEMEAKFSQIDVSFNKLKGHIADKTRKGIQEALQTVTLQQEKIDYFEREQKRILEKMAQVTVNKNNIETLQAQHVETKNLQVHAVQTIPLLTHYSIS